MSFSQPTQPDAQDFMRALAFEIAAGRGTSDDKSMSREDELTYSLYALSLETLMLARENRIRALQTLQTQRWISRGIKVCLILCLLAVVQVYTAIGRLTAISNTPSGTLSQPGSSRLPLPLDYR
jgi:hypothetical protein